MVLKICTVGFESFDFTTEELWISWMPEVSLILIMITILIMLILIMIIMLIPMMIIILILTQEIVVKIQNNFVSVWTDYSRV